MRDRIGEANGNKQEKCLDLGSKGEANRQKRNASIRDSKGEANRDKQEKCLHERPQRRGKQRQTREMP
jgi:hypothetical protein